MITEATKVCSKCKRSKPVSCFGLNSKHSDGLHSQCRDCNAAYQREKYKDPVARKERSERNRARYQNPEARAARSVQDRAYRYGIPEQEVERFLEVPACQACGEPFSDAPRQIHIDHCHDTNAVRGVVCMGCNRTMHGAHDKCIIRLRACIDYLERHSEWRSIEQG